MAVAMAVTDNGDNTGGSAVVSGVGSGAAVSVYYSSWSGEMGQLAWALGGTRTGSGAVTLSLAAGYWVFLAVSVESGVTTFSSLSYQNFTTGLLPIHEQILDAVKVRHDGRGFTSWLPTAKVLKRWVPKIWEVVTPPAVAISPVGTEEYDDKVINRDDPWYPVLVALIEKGQDDNTALMTRVLTWRHSISAAFRNQRLPGVSEVIMCRIKPLDIVQPEALKFGYLVSVLMFQFLVRETRG